MTTSLLFQGNLFVCVSPVWRSGTFCSSLSVFHCRDAAGWLHVDTSHLPGGRQVPASFAAAVSFHTHPPPSFVLARDMWVWTRVDGEPPCPPCSEFQSAQDKVRFVSVNVFPPAANMFAIKHRDKHLRSEPLQVLLPFIYLRTVSGRKLKKYMSINMTPG